MLLLINVGSISAPLAGVAIIHHQDLTELVIPPEVENIVEVTSSAATSFEFPQFIEATWDEETFTCILTFQFTNTFDFNLTLNQVSADIACTLHNYPLGHTSLLNQVHLEPQTTQMITILFTWTQEAEEHFLTEHSEEQTVNVTLSNLVLDVSGINIETPEQIVLNIPTAT
jgi:hypothetical protein